MITELERKIDLVKAFMQVEGGLYINGTCYNYDRDGGVEFSTSNLNYKIVMDKQQVDLINNCKTVQEIYGSYKEMEYF